MVWSVLSVIATCLELGKFGAEVGRRALVDGPASVIDWAVGSRKQVLNPSR